MNTPFLKFQKKTNYTGFAIAIAWPETYCKQVGEWYDGISNFIGLSKNHYYKVGHAALVLLADGAGQCHYFDFGRYHSPLGQGRVRSAETDPNLAIKTRPEISRDKRKIENLHAILSELQLNAECHGEGKLHASYCRINYENAFAKATDMQQKSPIPYGPFRYKGSNCSRFVNTAILAGKPDTKTTFLLKYAVPFTPTPMNNVAALNNKVIIDKMLIHSTFCPVKILDKRVLLATLPPPERTQAVPQTAHWLSGEGVGSWFDIKPAKSTYLISRYSKLGELEFEGHFENKSKLRFNSRSAFKIGYLSHSRQVRIEQGNHIIEFKRVH